MRKLLFLMCIATRLAAQNSPIALHPQNPHYFIYQQKPAVLITSGEHYGAVMNLDFDYEKYLATLQADGLNLTRLFTGAYVEPNGAFNIDQNTMAPLPLRFICPWARSNEDGYANGGKKFDLTQWDTAYFSRLKSFVAAAQRRNIIVELAFFCPFYDSSQWKLSPMNDNNNITPVATGIERTDVYTISEKTRPINALQAKLVRKIVTELNNYDNILYELINEPYFGGVTKEWQHFIAMVVDSTEQQLPKKHLRTQNIANGYAVIEQPDPLVSVFNFHYASPPYAVVQNYQLNKVIGCNETGFNGTSDSVYRLQAWQFMLAGGGLFNNLDYSFVAGYENGTFQYHADQPGGGSVAYRKQLNSLSRFINSFDFIKMQPDSNFITATQAVTIRSVAEKGKQYAAHIIGSGSVDFNLSIPAGKYIVSWVDPLTAAVISTKTIQVKEDKASIQAPAFATDIALKILRK